MAHHHHHEDSDTYYLDQICLVALSAAFGAVCLSLYTWQRSMLNIMLAEQFHIFVLASGVLLTGLALIRAAVLWKAVGQPTAEHAHAHEHVHAHANDHAHAECSHTHDHDHAECSPAHEHDHTPGHDHGHHDHDHDWAPWRYVLLLVPIILFLLGLPNKPPEIRGEAVQLDMSQEAASVAGLLGTGMEPLASAVTAGALLAESAATNAPTVRFSILEEAAASPDSRQEWAGKSVRVLGQFKPAPGSDRQFTVFRLKIRCCAADVIPLKVPMICKERVSGIQPEQWVKVTGRVEFRPVGNSVATVLLVPNRQAIQIAQPEANPYEQ